VDECADTYTDDALLEAKPFGTFAGREAIRSFWMDLVANGARELNYERIQVVQLDENTVHVSAQWTMNIGGGFISLERWENRGGRWMLAEDRFEVLSSAVAVG
jgi:ketosteroid isomerase-like protein